MTAAPTDDGRALGYGTLLSLTGKQDVYLEAPVWTTKIDRYCLAPYIQIQHLAR